LEASEHMTIAKVATMLKVT